MANDQLGKRMKSQYESRTRTYLPRRTYTIIRLDGKAFHTFTRGMERPYDVKFMEAMDATAKFLCENIQGCKMAYVQSDEISLLLTDFSTITTDAWFDGQVQKMVSVSASMATAAFNRALLKTMNLKKFEKVKDEEISISFSALSAYNAPMAFFDARVFTIPDPVEVENYFVWRQKDAMRNSLSMVAQFLFSHKELQGKSQEDMKQMICEKQNTVSWDNSIPLGFKMGRTFHNLENGKWRNCFSYFQDKIHKGIEEFRAISQFIPKITYE